MTTDSIDTPSEDLMTNTVVTPVSAPKTKVHSSKTDRKNGVQERFMLILTIAFFGGVAMDMMVPKTSAAYAIGMTLYCVFVIWALYKFGT